MVTFKGLDRHIICLQYELIKFDDTLKLKATHSEKKPPYWCTIPDHHHRHEDPSIPPVVDVGGVGTWPLFQRQDQGASQGFVGGDLGVVGDDFLIGRWLSGFIWRMCYFQSSLFICSKVCIRKAHVACDFSAWISLTTLGMIQSYLFISLLSI